MKRVGEVATLLALMAGRLVRAHEEPVVRAVNAKRQVHADAWTEAFAFMLARTGDMQSNASHTDSHTA